MRPSMASTSDFDPFLIAPAPESDPQAYAGAKRSAGWASDPGNGAFAYPGPSQTRTRIAPSSEQEWRSRGAGPDVFRVHEIDNAQRDQGGSGRSCITNRERN